MWGFLERFAVRFLKWRGYEQEEGEEGVYSPDSFRFNMYVVARDIQHIRKILESYEDAEQAEWRKSNISENPPENMVI